MKTYSRVFILNSPQRPVMLHATNVNETEKYEVVSFCQANTLQVKWRTERS